MTLLAQMAIQGAVGFAIGAGTNDLAIRWVFNALFIPASVWQLCLEFWPLLWAYWQARQF